MKLVKVVRPGANAEGILVDSTVHIVGPWRDGDVDAAPFTLSRLDSQTLVDMLAASIESVELADVELAMPLDPAAKLICAGVNYRAHAGEISAEEPANPILFTRLIDSLVPHGAALIRPKASETLDFEGEIAVVIGGGGRHIPVEEALSHVSGYTCFNDGSVREYQRHALTTGKNFWRTGSIGPWVVPAAQIGDADIALETRLNGQVMQSALASQMIFSIAELISYCSRWTPLAPGDIIATGTPGGVGSRRTPPLWMKPGDVVEVEIEKIGCLRNPIAAEL
jgi:2-keto-4-pentenoate hydratase/2-oxohepta-3-ene-1,7-dioic acid hydratase in catechol pathway